MRLRVKDSGLEEGITPERRTASWCGSGDLPLLIEHSEELKNQFFVPQACLCFLAHGYRRLLVAEGGLVRPRRTESVVNIHHLKNAREQWNILVRKSVGISAAVEVLAMI